MEEKNIYSKKGVHYIYDRYEYLTNVPGTGKNKMFKPYYDFKI